MSSGIHFHKRTEGVRQQMFKRIQKPIELYLLETALMEYSI
ncbi:hypothetical protein [Christiangramia flava]|uniref:Uncharacterized protein n=1 Tax=Christiangramia flava JLT2011 TaxID=1229726 RepID=A0A1L7I780_9FLAO|nr:hypothetical protein [Christiangramia flava]APU69468.1 hypothetical protein GRFL_2744 [Christiangramia flava JLT2011]OSS37931.1 hypothetical protein C723_3210 [Christiangramia flava JLT2011]